MGQEDIKKLRNRRVGWSTTFLTTLAKWLEEPDHTGKPNIELLYDKGLIEELKNYKPQEKMNITTYPEIAIAKSFKDSLHSGKEWDFKIGTYLRLQHQGIWYDIKILKEYTFYHTMKNESLARMLEQFHKEVYLHQQLYVIDPTLTDQSGRPVHIPSGDQRSEQQRLEDQYRFGELIK